MIFSFSGLDGSGKTTLIDHLRSILEKEGYKTVVLTMYDNLSFYSVIRRCRDRIKRLLKVNIDELESKKEVSGSVVLLEPLFSWEKTKIRDPKIGVSDKKGIVKKILYSIVRSACVRRISLFLDIFVLLTYRVYFEIIKNNVIITDRYLYDSLADVADLESKKWFFVKIFLLFAPRPQVPIFVDVSPEDAFARKGEYPIDYMHWRRSTYLKIFSYISDSKIIKNDVLEEAIKKLENLVLTKMK